MFLSAKLALPANESRNNDFQLNSLEEELNSLFVVDLQISKLHHVENELWVAKALSSSIIKPLTAPELAAICSALLFTGGETDSESSGNDPGSVNKVCLFYRHFMSP